MRRLALVLALLFPLVAMAADPPKDAQCGTVTVYRTPVKCADPCPKCPDCKVTCPDSPDCKLTCGACPECPEPAPVAQQEPPVHPTPAPATPARGQWYALGSALYVGGGTGNGDPQKGEGLGAGLGYRFPSEWMVSGQVLVLHQDGTPPIHCHGQDSGGDPTARGIMFTVSIPLN